jgi:uncharacterized membrane protein YdbT with pleckstrin-like domain
MENGQLRIIRKNPTFLVTKITTFVFALSLVYSFFIFGTDYDDYLNNIFPFFQMFEVGMVTFILITLLEIFFAIIQLLHWTHETYKVQFDEIIYQSGLISIKRKQFALKNMEHIFCKQSLLGRIFNYGTITLHGRFLKEPINIHGVADPLDCAEFIKKSTILSQLNH